MRRHELTDVAWRTIEHLLPGREGYPGGRAEDNRLFVNAAIWIARSGAPWRDLPERFGLWNSVFQRFNRWSRSGIWKSVAEALQSPDLAALLLDSTGSSCASTCCGLPKKETDEEALGRSRGGFGSKLHISVDIQGQPVNICLGPGEEHDVTRAEELLGDERPDGVIADKGYDSDELVAAIRRRGAEAVIPPRSNRTTKRRWNKRKYKLRNLAERFINRIKHYRRVATRYEKTARNYLSFVHLASALVLLGVTCQHDLAC